MAARLGALLAETRARLAEAGIEDAGLEARLLVGHFSEATSAQMIADAGMPVRATSVSALRAAVERRIGGQPVHRLIGYREFYGLKLLLSPGTLEPRPDTETLVELVLPQARRIAAHRGLCRILDLGTGTGAIALALLSAVPEAVATGVDISADALATALRNADINGYSARFDALQSDWFSGVDGVFEVIVSNPPYIMTADLEKLSREVREHDPHAALDGGQDGLDFYRLIAEGAAPHLVREGIVAVEIGHDQKAAVLDIFADRGWSLVETARDLEGRDRAIAFHRGPSWDTREKRLGNMV